MVFEVTGSDYFKSEEQISTVATSTSLIDNVDVGFVDAANNNINFIYFSQGDGNQSKIEDTSGIAPGDEDTHLFPGDEEETRTPIFSWPLDAQMRTKP